MIKKMIKKAIIIGFVWCLTMVIINTLFLWLGIFKPGGYTPWVNPIGIFIISFPFFFLAAILYQFLSNKKNWNKWLGAAISVVIIYITAVSHMILDDDYLRTFDWKVPVFLFVQVGLLVLIDSLVAKYVIRKDI